MSKYLQGKYKPLNPEKYRGDVNNIIYRSSWELKFLRWADRNRSVIKYSSEELQIPYISRIDNKPHRYFVDFVVTMVDKNGKTKTAIIEIKPSTQKRPPRKPKTKRGEGRYLKEYETWIRNCDKWKAATKYAEKVGSQFLILDEYDLGIKKRENKK